MNRLSFAIIITLVTLTNLETSIQAMTKTTYLLLEELNDSISNLTSSLEGFEKKYTVFLVNKLNELKEEANNLNKLTAKDEKTKLNQVHIILEKIEAIIKQANSDINNIKSTREVDLIQDILDKAASVNQAVSVQLNKDNKGIEGIYYKKSEDIIQLIKDTEATLNTKKRSIS